MGMGIFLIDSYNCYKDFYKGKSANICMMLSSTTDECNSSISGPIVSALKSINEHVILERENLYL